MYKHLIGIRFNRHTLMSVALILLIALVAVSYIGAVVPERGPWRMYAAAAVAVLAVVAIVMAVVTVHGAQLWQWRRIRRIGSATPEPARVDEWNGVGIVWGGDAATVWVEVSQNVPFAMTTIDRSGGISAKPINTARLARKLHQRDIVVDSLRVVNHGYRSVLDSSSHNATAAVTDAIGATPMHVGARTFIPVAVSTLGSLSAIRDRARDGGIDAVVIEAASRVRVEMEAQDFAARLLSKNALQAITEDQAIQLAPSLEHVGRRSLGNKGARVYSVTSLADTWKASTQSEARALPAHRVLENLTIRTSADGTPTASLTQSYLSHTDRLARLLRGIGLRSAVGQQASAVSAVVPGWVAAPLWVPEHSVSAVTPPPMYPGGLGLYVGTSADDGRTFLRLAGGMGATLWLAGSMMMVRHMVLRATLLALTIDIRTSNETEKALWEDFVRKVRSRLVTVNRGGAADVIICPAADVREHEGGEQTVIAYTHSELVFVPEVSIVEYGGKLVVTHGRKQRRIDWTSSTDERRYMTVPEPSHA